MLASWIFRHKTTKHKKHKFAPRERRPVFRVKFLYHKKYRLRNYPVQFALRHLAHRIIVSSCACAVPKPFADPASLPYEIIGPVPYPVQLRQLSLHSSAGTLQSQIAGLKVFSRIGYELPCFIGIELL